MRRCLSGPSRSRFHHDCGRPRLRRPHRARRVSGSQLCPNGVTRRLSGAPISPATAGSALLLTSAKTRADTHGKPRPGRSAGLRTAVRARPSRPTIGVLSIVHRRDHAGNVGHGWPLVSEWAGPTERVPAAAAPGAHDADSLPELREWERVRDAAANDAPESRPPCNGQCRAGILPHADHG